MGKQTGSHIFLYIKLAENIKEYDILETKDKYIKGICSERG